MIYSFRKNQVLYSSRISSGILGWKWHSLRENHGNGNGIVSLGIRFISAIANATETEEQSFTVSYLINKGGLSPQSALAASKRVCFKTPDRPDSVISFFDSHGFSKPQISSLIEKYPALLLCDPQKKFLPKFKFFYSKGISSSNLATILSTSPYVLRSSLHSRIVPAFYSFKNMIGCDDDKVLAAYKRFPNVLRLGFSSAAAPNLDVLREYGVIESSIASKVVHHPGMFYASNEKFKRTVEEVKQLGFNPLKRGFLYALQALLLQMNKSTFERKFNLLKKWGWSDEEIAWASAKFPHIMMFSEKKIRATMNFYVNTMGMKSSSIARRPNLLGLSLKKRIIPRFSIVKILMSKGFIKGKTSLPQMLLYTEKIFLKRFVFPFKDPYLLKIYKEKLGISK